MTSAEIEYKDLTIRQNKWGWTDIHVLDLSGDFVGKTNGPKVFADAIANLPPASRVVVNLNRLEHASDTAAAALLQAYTKVGDLRLAAPRAQLSKILNSANVATPAEKAYSDAIMRIYPTTDDAVAAIQATTQLPVKPVLVMDDLAEGFFALRREKINDRAFIIRIHGEITIGAGDDVIKNEVSGILAATKAPQLLLDLKGTPYIDSAGLGEIVRTYTLVSRSGGNMSLLNLPKRITDLLSITKLLTIFETYEDETDWRKERLVFATDPDANPRPNA